jgi:hypothetical protein
MKEIRI